MIAVPNVHLLPPASPVTFSRALEQKVLQVIPSIGENWNRNLNRKNQTSQENRSSGLVFWWVLSWHPIHLVASLAGGLLSVSVPGLRLFRLCVAVGTVLQEDTVVGLAQCERACKQTWCSASLDRARKQQGEALQNRHTAVHTLSRARVARSLARTPVPQAPRGLTPDPLPT